MLSWLRLTGPRFNADCVLRILDYVCIVKPLLIPAGPAVVCCLSQMLCLSQDRV